MAKKIHAKHKKHRSGSTKPTRVSMHGKGPGSNISLPEPEQTIHLKPTRLYDTPDSTPSRRNTEKHAGTSEHEPDSNVFDSGKE